MNAPECYVIRTLRVLFNMKRFFRLVGHVFNKPVTKHKSPRDYVLPRVHLGLFLVLSENVFPRHGKICRCFLVQSYSFFNNLYLFSFINPFSSASCNAYSPPPLLCPSAHGRLCSVTILGCKSTVGMVQCLHS